MPKLTEALVLSRSKASSLDNVKKFNCWASKIDDISIIKNMPNVEVVNLSCNNITTLEPFYNCLDLSELYIRRNSIATLAEIRYLQGLTNLRNLWLADNPCTDGDKYRLTVIKALPCLEKLDNEVVTDEEKRLAVYEGQSLDISDDSVVSCDDADHPDGSRLDHTPQNVSPSLNGDLEDEDPAMLSMNETNRIRLDLGLKPVSSEKVTPTKHSWNQSKTVRRSVSGNTLQAVLLLIEDLDDDELEAVGNVVRDKLSVAELSPPEL